MTCIVGIEHLGGVTIGGDSAGLAGWSLTIRADEKVFSSGGYLFGFSSSFRMGQILRYSLDVPRPPSRSLDRFMATTFINAMRTALKDGGYTKTDSGREQSGTFLVGAAGKLFAVYDDHQVARVSCGFNSVGCGSDLALGSLHTTAGMHLPPTQRARLALNAAADQSGGVAGPFRIKSLEATA
jgi:hypothetical protein